MIATIKNPRGELYSVTWKAAETKITICFPCSDGQNTAIVGGGVPEEGTSVATSTDFTGAPKCQPNVSALLEGVMCILRANLQVISCWLTNTQRRMLQMWPR